MSEEQGILNIYKKLGETPLECLNRFRENHPEYAGVPMTYAGRLDPLAEGVLIALAGEARFRREEFNILEKTYKFEVLWGMTSDTFDPLGIVKLGETHIDISERLLEVLPKFRGVFDLMYPHYSSRTVDGVPLWKLSREGKLAGREVPSNRVNISLFEAVETRQVSADELAVLALKKIAAVGGDFRQEEAAASWRKAADMAKGKMFSVTKFRAQVSSGTYVRSLADELGRALGSGGLAWSICRTSVGDFNIEDSIH